MLCTTKDQNARQFHTMIMDFLKAYYLSAAFDAHDVSIGLQSCWGIRADWHEVSSVLERQHAHGILTHEGFSRDRMARYGLKVA